MGQFVAAYMSNIDDKWCLKWNEFDTNIKEYLRILREDQRLFDVTLVTDDGQHMQAHKIILSAGSHFFSDILLKSNQTNMLIYLKGISSVQLENLLDFIYNGEASVGQEELKEFLETGKELQFKGFEAYELDETKRYINENEELHENGENITKQNVTFDTLETLMENNHSLEESSKPKIIEKIPINTNTELYLQVLGIIEMSDAVWKCKVCGKTTVSKGNIRQHAERHIEGMSHACHICNNSFFSRHNLQCHISRIHSELLSCDLCGKSGMNKMAYYDHKRRQHKALSGRLS